MATTPYTGFAMRAAAHFDSRPPPPGINGDHLRPDPEPDPFNPVPDTPDDQGGTLWGNPPEIADQSGQPNLAQVPVSHWFPGQHAVPSGVPYATAQQAMQERMMVDHGFSNYVPDSIRLYQHATEGQVNDFIVGRAPREAGATIPDGPLAALANGHNSYDQTNAANEVYAGADPANVGRYRLGTKTNVWGLYSSPIGKFGQDALLHAYTGLTPTFPADKNQLNEAAAPYTPNSSGANGFWGPAGSWQLPSLFAVPSETAITDVSTIDGDQMPSGDFSNRDRL